jgi:hypothetical protein
LRWSSLCPYRPLPHSCQLFVGFAAFYFIKGRWTAVLPHCRIAFGGGFDSFDMDHLKLGAEFSCAWFPRLGFAPRAKYAHGTNGKRHKVHRLAELCHPEESMTQFEWESDARGYLNCLISRLILKM